MEKSESIKEIVPAIIKVMGAVKSIEKSMTVGTGLSAYKGVPDAAVKAAIGEAMEANGLCIVPTSISAETTIERWSETYNNNEKIKGNRKDKYIHAVVSDCGNYCNVKYLKSCDNKEYKIIGVYNETDNA